MISVASYCRVSTDREDQANSFSAQQHFFTQYIAHNPAWTLFNMYADQGLSGTNTKNRPEFLRMIQDAKRGQFQIILTKEVSRFSRNLLDTIAYTRMLKSMGIFVIFLTDGINTQDPDAELRLSIMASIAQEESRKTSTRVKWGQTRQMERGVVFGHSMLGYDVKNGTISVNPEGAELVQRIFHMYGVERLGCGRIAEILTQAGYCTPTGKPNWTPSYILKILKNEKYRGDLIQKKSYTPDYLTHQKKANHGEEPMVVIRQHHTPIISPQLWELVQQERRRRNRHHTKGSSVRHALSGKIICGMCGAHFVARQKRSPNGAAILRWSCSTVVQGGACKIGQLLRDDDAKHMFCQAIAGLEVDQTAVVHQLLSVLQEAKGNRIQHWKTQWQSLQRKKEAVMDAYFSGNITAQDMKQMKERYQQQLDQLSEHPPTEQNTAGIDAALYALMNGSLESDVFYKTLLHQIVVWPDRHIELTLQHLPHVFHFIYESR